MAWKAGLAILVACLFASIVIAVYKLSTTPVEIFGDGYQGVPADQRQR